MFWAIDRDLVHYIFFYFVVSNNLWRTIRFLSLFFIFLFTSYFHQCFDRLILSRSLHVVVTVCIKQSIVNNKLHFVTYWLAYYNSNERDLMLKKKIAEVKNYFMGLLTNVYGQQTRLLNRSRDFSTSIAYYSNYSGVEKLWENSLIAPKTCKI